MVLETTSQSSLYMEHLGVHEQEMNFDTDLELLQVSIGWPIRRIAKPPMSSISCQAILAWCRPGQCQSSFAAMYTQISIYIEIYFVSILFVLIGIEELSEK